MVIPGSVVREVQAGYPEKRKLDYSYRSQWWVSHNELGSFEAQGIHGQRLYFEPKAG